MAISFNKKKNIIQQITLDSLKTLHSAIIDYTKISASNMNVIRKETRSNNIKIRVINNRLAKIAIKETKLKNIQNYLTGNSMLIFYHGDNPGNLFNILYKILNNNLEFKIKYLILAGKIYSPDKIKEFSNLPTITQSLELFCYLLKLPITNFNISLKEILKKLLMTLNIYKNSKNKDVNRSIQ